jgi:LemA protein
MKVARPRARFAMHRSARGTVGLPAGSSIGDISMAGRPFEPLAQRQHQRQHCAAFFCYSLLQACHKAHGKSASTVSVGRTLTVLHMKVVHMTRVLAIIGAIAVILVVTASAVGASYNRLVTLDQAVQSQWAQVESSYQRRADLIPNLVETVKGAANFEKSTYIAVAEARAKVGQVNVVGSSAPNDSAAFDRYASAQDGLSNAVSRLLAVAEVYPQLRATQNFSDLQAQLEGTENRIAVERMRFNQAAQTFNTARDSFPTVLVVHLFGTRFDEKAYFKSQPGAQRPPAVKLP